MSTLGARARTAGGAVAERPRRVRVRLRPDPSGRTFIAEQYAEYPFHLARPFYLDETLPGMLTLYLQSVAGGIFEGDRHDIQLVAEEGSAGHLTTQASTIVHGMRGGYAEQHVHLRAERGSVVEFVPDPVILFPGSRLRSCTEVVADASATVFLADSFLGHDPKGDGGRFEAFHSEVRIARPDGRLLCVDRFAATSEAHARSIPGVTGRWPAQGSVYACAPGRSADDVSEALTQALDDLDGVYGAASTLPGEIGAWARVLAVSGAALETAMSRLWRAFNAHYGGGVPAARRK